MKIDTLAHVKNQLSAVVEGLGSEPLFITRNGKVAAVLQAIADEEVEDYLLRNSPRFWRLMQDRRDQARRGEVLAFDPARYEYKTDRSASTNVVREKTSGYKPARKPRKRD